MHLRPAFRHPPSPFRHELVHWLTVAALTFVIGQFDRLFFYRGEVYGALLLAPGCLLPLFLWWGFRLWPAALCGAAATLLFLPGLRTVAAQFSWISIPALAAGFAVELGLTVWLLRRWRFRDDLSRGQDALLLVSSACLGTIVSGWIVMPVVYWPESLSLAEFLRTCGTWWLMHFVSMVVFAPAWLIWKRWGSTPAHEWWIIGAIGAGLGLFELIGFQLWNVGQQFAALLLFAGFPLALWGVLRYGMRAASVIVVVTALIAGHAAATGAGPLVESEPMRSNLQLNLFLLSVGLTLNLLGCYSEENRERVERLKVDHALLAKAEEIAGFGSWQYEADTNQEHWSPQLYRLLGLLPEEIPADLVTFRDRFVVPDDRQRFFDSWKSFVKTGQPDRIELRIVRTDNRERILVGQADIQRDATGRPTRFVGTLRDVTERRLAIEERQRMQELLNKAEELAQVGSWEMDGTGNMPRWSENMYRICGIAAGEFDGTLATFLSRFVHPDDRAGLQTLFENFAAGTGPDWAEFRIVRADGEVRDVYSHIQVARRESGQLVRCYGTTTDITDRKRAERKLQESEWRYRLLADHASDMISRIQEDGVILYVSPACERILGYSATEMTGTSWHDYIAPEDHDACRQMLTRVAAGDASVAVLFRGQRRDGSTVWLESKPQLLINVSGSRELICVTRDVTQRRLLEEQVAQAQRLEAIGRLAGGIAHDFNNILTVINGYAEILELKFPKDDPAARHVTSILEAGQRAAQLTRQLLAFGRKQLVTQGQVNLNELIQKLNPLLPPLMGETIEIVIRLDPELASFEAAAAQIEQLIMNLVINARDAMPDGGVLTIETHNQPVGEGESHPSALSPGNYVQLIIGDTGEGMDETVKARLFEPFFTTKRVGEGTGLGLPMVYATVEQCHGAIQVDSAPRRGTRFELFFPARSPGSAAASVVKSPRLRPSLPAEHRRILVVEDDSQVRSLVELTLTQAHYQVVTAPSGDDALQIVGNNPQQFDLVLTDVVMKGMNGRELVDRLRQQSPQLPVIFMSGHTEDEVVRRGVLHDELTFLQKPFSADELVSRIRQVLSRQAV